MSADHPCDGTNDSNKENDHHSATDVVSNTIHNNNEVVFSNSCTGVLAADSFAAPSQSRNLASPTSSFLPPRQSSPRQAEQVVDNNNNGRSNNEEVVNAARRSEDDYDVTRLTQDQEHALNFVFGASGRPFHNGDDNDDNDQLYFNLLMSIDEDNQEDADIQEEGHEDDATQHGIENSFLLASQGDSLPANIISEQASQSSTSSTIMHEGNVDASSIRRQMPNHMEQHHRRHSEAVFRQGPRHDQREILSVPSDENHEDATAHLQLVPPRASEVPSGQQRRVRICHDDGVDLHSTLVARKFRRHRLSMHPQVLLSRPLLTQENEAANEASNNIGALARHASATMVQGVVRGFVVRRRYRRFRKSLVFLQKQARRRRSLKTAAAVQIQSAHRTKSCKATYQQVRGSVIRVQLIARQRLAKQAYKTLFEARQQHDAAVRIQSARRVKSCKATYQQLLRMVIRVQSMARQRLATQEYQQLLRLVIWLQSVVRQRSATQAYLTIREEKRRYDAVVKIQAFLQAKSCAANYQQFRESVILLQAVARQRSATQAYQALRQRRLDAAVKIQSVLRAKNARTEYQAARNFIQEAPDLSDHVAANVFQTRTLDALRQCPNKFIGQRVACFYDVTKDGQVFPNLLHFGTVKQYIETSNTWKVKYDDDYNLYVRNTAVPYDVHGMMQILKLYKDTQRRDFPR